MNQDLQQVVDALARAKAAPNVYNIRGTMADQSLEAMATQSIAVGTALLAWLEYTESTPNTYSVAYPDAIQPLEATLTQAMSTNAAVLAWLAYQVKKEQEKVK